MNGITMRMLTQPREDREEDREHREPETHHTMAYGYPMREPEPMRRPVEPEHTMPRAGLYDGGGMGFGASATYGDIQRPKSNIKATGTVWMTQPEESGDGMELDRETAERWVASMEGTDPNHPHGGKWTAEAIKPLAQKNGFPTDGPEFWAFYAICNAMYSDYSATAKRYGITSPDFYAALAADFIRDSDAQPDKVERYMRYIAKA